MSAVACSECGRTYGLREAPYICDCEGLLEIRYDPSEVAKRLEGADLKKRPLGVWRYREILPVNVSAKVITMQEGGTGLYRCEKLSRALGLREVYVKNEGENPTGSFKDRGMTVGVTEAVFRRSKAVICASTGNTASSLAAYAAKANLRCIVLVPHAKISLQKFSQIIAYGAQIVEVGGTFDDALSLAIQASSKMPVYLLNSVNPFRIEGQKTAAFEILDQLEEVPDVVVLPVGNAGNIWAYWKGFKEYQEFGLVDRVPRMVGIQAAGASPIVEAFKKGSDCIEPVEKPDTIASAIRIGKPVNWKRALRILRESSGLAETITDDEILKGQLLLASKEGIFAELAGAASIAGLVKLVERGEIDRDERVVCVVTGHGLKDLGPLLDVAGVLSIEPSLEELERVLSSTR